MIKLAQIRQFVTLAEEGSFHRAASALNMAQPPLSVGIRKLEEDLGAQLFVRAPRGVRLTSAGEVALLSARLTLQHVEEMREAVRMTAAGERGRLRVGFVASATLALLPKLLIAYRAKYPRVEFKLDESRTAELLEDVENGRLDVAIVRTPVMTRSRVTIEQLETDSLRLAVRKDSKWAGRTSIELAELCDEPFIVFSRERVPSMHAITMLLCQREGFVPQIAEEAGQLRTILCLVESGIGVALVPGVAANQGGEFELIDIGQTNEHSVIGLGLVTGLGEIGAAAKNFRAVAREACAPKHPEPAD
jgi:DNA-binding transcriptional LysR family regulator